MKQKWKIYLDYSEANELPYRFLLFFDAKVNLNGAYIGVVPQLANVITTQGTYETELKKTSGASEIVFDEEILKADYMNNNPRDLFRFRKMRYPSPKTIETT